MTRPSKPLSIRLGEFRPVLDAVELTKGLRSRIVGGKKRSAVLVPAEGGLTVELFGSNIFVPIATGALDQELRVDADLLVGFLSNSSRSFHPAEIVRLDIGLNHLVGSCGTLKVTMRLGASPSSVRQGYPYSVARTAADLLSPEPDCQSDRVEDFEPIPEPPTGQFPEDEGNQDSGSETGPTETDLRLWEAESELYLIEEIERELKSAKRRRPDYERLRFFAVGWFLLLAISELVFGGENLAWLVVVGSVAYFAEAWSEASSRFEWERERREKEQEIPKILKRIELMGYSARQEPSRWVLSPTSKKDASDA